jgi:hypothetical protein
MDTAPDDLIPLSEARLLIPSRKGGRVAIQTLYRWILKGKLRGWRIGAYWFASRTEVLALPERVSVQLAPQAAARLEERERAARTDAILAAHGLLG